MSGESGEGGRATAKPRSGWHEYADRAEWLAARKNGLGSSDAAAVLGANKWQSPLSVWQDKLGLKEDEPDNRYTLAGRYLEPAVARWFEDETGLVVADPGDFRIYWSPAHEQLFCTPDRLLPEPSEEEKQRLGLEGVEGDGVLEIKTASAYLIDEWGDEPPLHHQIQVQHQLDVLGARWGVIAVLVGGNDFRWFRVDRNERFVGKMRDRLLRFWAQHVKPGVEPPADMPKDLKEWESLHPGADGKVVDLGQEFVLVDQRLQEIKGESNRLEREHATLQAKLKHAIGDATLAHLPNGASYSYRTVDVKAARIVRKAHQYRRLTRRKPK